MPITPDEAAKTGMHGTSRMKAIYQGIDDMLYSGVYKNQLIEVRLSDEGFIRSTYEALGWAISTGYELGGYAFLNFCDPSDLVSDRE